MLSDITPDWEQSYVAAREAAAGQHDDLEAGLYTPRDGETRLSLDDGDDGVVVVERGDFQVRVLAGVDGSVLVNVMAPGNVPAVAARLGVRRNGAVCLRGPKVFEGLE